MMHWWQGGHGGVWAERLQLESAERLFAAIAIMNVLALCLSELRERLRM
jgi:hypothetical protein